MRDTVQFRLVDAFAETPYTGNPAGVVLDADNLNDQQMQAIAREVNASETSFISGTNDLHCPAAFALVYADQRGSIFADTRRWQRRMPGRRWLDFGRCWGSRIPRSSSRPRRDC